MVKIRYTGDINPCKVKIANGFINDWHTGEIKEINDAFAHKLLVQTYFELIDGEVIKAPIKSDKVIVEEKCKTCGPRPKTIEEEPVEEPEDEPEPAAEEKVFDYKTAYKDSLLDFTAENDIEADYSMTVSELREKIKEFLEDAE